MLLLWLRLVIVISCATSRCRGIINLDGRKGRPSGRSSFVGTIIFISIVVAIAIAMAMGIAVVPHFLRSHCRCRVWTHWNVSHVRKLGAARVMCLLLRITISGRGIGFTGTVGIGGTDRGRMLVRNPVVRNHIIK